MILSIVGTRPNLIKYAAMDAALKELGETEWKWIDSQQHYDYSVSGMLYDTFDLSSPIATAPGYGLGFWTDWLVDIIGQLKPSMVVVYGDTTTTLAGALAAKYANTPLAHVEAGLRTLDYSLPEETNRVVADALADLNLASGGGLHLEALELIDNDPPENEGEYYLLDIHRNFNVDKIDRLKSIFEAAESLPKPVKFIMHHRIKERPGGSNVTVLSPQPYADMIHLIKGASKVITDSGGVQREAYQLRIPCITVRPSTEWIETLDGGCNVLVEPDGIGAAVASPGDPVWNDDLFPPESVEIIEAVNEWVSA